LSVWLGFMGNALVIILALFRKRLQLECCWEFKWQCSALVKVRLKIWKPTFRYRLRVKRPAQAYTRHNIAGICNTRVSKTLQSIQDLIITWRIAQDGAWSSKYFKQLTWICILRAFFRIYCYSNFNFHGHNLNTSSAWRVVHKRKTNKRAINKFFIFTLVQEVLEMTMCTDT
jgi:hypothetical protein